MTPAVSITELDASAQVDRPGRYSLRALLTSRMGASGTAALLVLLLWQGIGMISEKLPVPSEVIRAFYDEVSRGEFLSNFVPTVERFLIGMALAIVIGGVLGLLIGSSRLMDDFLGDLNLVGLAIPAVIFAMLCVMWFGFGNMAPIVTVILSGVPFVAVNVGAGARSVSPMLLQMARSYGVSRTGRVRHVILPAVSGYVFAGIRFAVFSGWNGLLLSEWFGASEGVGFRARYWYDANRMPGFLAWTIFFILFMLLLDRVILETISRRVFRWRDSEKDRTAAVETRVAA